MKRVALLILAASVLVGAGVYGFHAWRLRWQDGRAWQVDHGAASLAQGASLSIANNASSIDIARLGVIVAQPGTDLTLQTTSERLHRINLTRGEIDVRVWAPPGRVGVTTPAGDVVDLGCVFRVSVTDDGTTRLRVDSGWVLLDNVHGEQFVPAGASADMTPARSPNVPIYDDATDEFKQAVRIVEQNAQAPDPMAVKAIAFEARERDGFTLLMLADVNGLPRLVRSVMLERLSILHTAPAPDAIKRILDGDRDLYSQWQSSLPLPSLKNWWANWFDVFPQKLR